MWREFRDFAVRGNVVDLAVGLILGAAFTTIVNSLVTDLLIANFPYIFDPQYTARLEEELDDIEDGKEGCRRKRLEATQIRLAVVEDCDVLWKAHSFETRELLETYQTNVVQMRQNAEGDAGGAVDGVLFIVYKGSHISNLPSKAT